MMHFNTELFTGSNLRALTDPRFTIADETLESVADIDLEKHSEMGIKAYIFDIDHTLGRTAKEFHLYEAVDNKLIEIKESFRVCALSNNTLNDRLKSVLSIKEISSHVKKPNPLAFKRALEYLGTRPEETCMVGDNVFTDIVGAKRVGLYTVRVPPSTHPAEPWYIRLAHWIEDKFYRLHISRSMTYNNTKLER